MISRRSTIFGDHLILEAVAPRTIGSFRIPAHGLRLPNGGFDTDLLVIYVVPTTVRAFEACKSVTEFEIATGGLSLEELLAISV